MKNRMFDLVCLHKQARFFRQKRWYTSLNFDKVLLAGDIFLSLNNLNGRNSAAQVVVVYT